MKDSAAAADRKMALRVELVAATAVAFPFKGKGLGLFVCGLGFFFLERNGFFLKKYVLVVMVVESTFAVPREPWRWSVQHRVQIAPPNDRRLVAYT